MMLSIQNVEPTMLKRLYQGMTLVVPKSFIQIRALAPAAVFSGLHQL